MDQDQIRRLLKEIGMGNSEAVVVLLKEAKRRNDEELRGRIREIAWEHIFKWTCVGNLLIPNRWPENEEIERYYRICETPGPSSRERA